MFSHGLTFACILVCSFASPLAPLRTRSLLPNVTIKALPAGCASYPLYNADTDTAGPWSMTVSDSENPDLFNLGPSTAYSLSFDPRTGPVMRWGYLTLNPAVGYARTVLECKSNKLHALTETAVTRAGAPTNVQWTPLALSAYPYDADLLYLVDGDQPTLYEHYIGEQKQDGYFLGGYNTSTWGAKWYDADSTSHFLPYYYLRLLPEGQGLHVNETRVFLKFQA